MINGRLSDSIRDKIIKKSRPSTVGTIRCGKTEPAISKNGKQYNKPISLDYFVVTSKNKMYADMYNNIIGKTNSLMIQFETSNLNEVCYMHIVYRDSAGRNIAYGDGSVFNVWSTAKNDYIETQIEAEELKKQLNLDGKIEFNLIFKLWKLENSLTLWKYTSQGLKTTIKNVSSVFDKTVKFAFENDIEFSDIIFNLDVTKHKANNLSAKEYSTVSLVPLYIPTYNNHNINNLLTSKENLKLEN
jgi:hypothetical protein